MFNMSETVQKVFDPLSLFPQISLSLSHQNVFSYYLLWIITFWISIIHPACGVFEAAGVAFLLAAQLTTKQAVILL